MKPKGPYKLRKETFIAAFASVIVHNFQPKEAFTYADFKRRLTPEQRQMISSLYADCFSLNWDVFDFHDRLTGWIQNALRYLNGAYAGIRQVRVGRHNRWVYSYRVGSMSTKLFNSTIGTSV